MTLRCVARAVPRGASTLTVGHQQASQGRSSYQEFDLGTVRSDADAQPLSMTSITDDAKPCRYTSFGGKRIYYFWTCPDYVPTVYHCAKEGCLDCGDEPYAVFNNSECAHVISGGIKATLSPNSYRYECLAGPPTPRPTPDFSGLFPSPPTAADASSAAACSSSVPASFYAGLVLLTAAAVAGVYV